MSVDRTAEVLAHHVCLVLDNDQCRDCTRMDES